MPKIRRPYNYDFKGNERERDGERQKYHKTLYAHYYDMLLIFLSYNQIKIDIFPEAGYFFTKACQKMRLRLRYFDLVRVRSTKFFALFSLIFLIFRHKFFEVSVQYF